MKTAVITGGNSGIGKEVAIALAKNNYRVIINGRDAEKTKQAAAEIVTASNNKNVDYIVADISVISGMKKLAAEIKSRTGEIDSLVLSSGVIFPDRRETTDGLESMFTIQYLSRFAITQLLLPELQKGKAKIIHVGASKIKNAQIFFDDLSLKNNFSMFKAMGQCMYANYL
ncbi:MAG TPA: SDR family NAD(P)-dependent oxidoreductase, partial [Bacteroidia bacterium]|nr:SDR family NAD(P)-dependent oxidoreductase [Bacteroidia bacterium]